MPTYDEQDRPPGGTVYGAPAGPRPARDRGMLAALAVGATGVLVGTLLATGLLAPGGGRDPTPAGVSPVAGPDASSTTPGGGAAGSGSPDATPTVAGSESPAPAQPSDVRVFRSAASSLCLDVAAAADPEGAAVAQADCTGGPSQQWLVTPAEADAVTLVNAASSRCVDVDGGRQDDQAAVLQRSCSGAASQQWRLTPTAEGQWMIVNVNSGRCVDVPDANTSPGVAVWQRDCGGAPTQLWNTP